MNKEKRKKHRSLRFKLTICLISMLFMTIFLCWILNLTMMEKYFIHRSQKDIEEVYQTINVQYKRYAGVDNNWLESIAMGNNLKIMIVQPVESIQGITLETVYSSTGKDGKLYASMYQILEEMQKAMLFQENSVHATEMAKQGYTTSINKNPHMDNTTINLLGFLEGDYLIIIAASVESLQAAASVAVRFLTYSGLFVALISGVVMFLYTKRFTAPIEEMSEIADQMTHLDFDARIECLSDDEIGDLGRSMNQMSEQLEYTISKLKQANTELKRDIDQKIQIDEMRKEFLSHVSHELKTPIALIQGYAEGLSDQEMLEDPESRAFYCEVIMDEAQKMNTMVQKLLTLNQLEFGNSQMEFKRFHIDELIGQILEANELRFQQKNINVTFVQAAPACVWGDEYMIHDVLNNYISNAFHYADEGGEMKIWTENRNGKTRVWVYNDGALIPEEEMEKIWIKFYKVDKARTREYGGSGIGLSIVAAIMKGHQQEYGVVNLEHGPAFYFELENSI